MQNCLFSQIVFKCAICKQFKRQQQQHQNNFSFLVFIFPSSVSFSPMEYSIHINTYISFLCVWNTHLTVRFYCLYSFLTDFRKIQCRTNAVTVYKRLIPLHYSFYRPLHPPTYDHFSPTIEYEMQSILRNVPAIWMELIIQILRVFFSFVFEPVFANVTQELNSNVARWIKHIQY